jgi:Asp-tRNA(Asn)/Glu-tRNA(Gln) amidotransferase A subunit family amidase
MTLPVRWGDDGLPTSIQLAARPLAEDRLLQVGRQLEEALGFRARPVGLPNGYDAGSVAPLPT